MTTRPRRLSPEQRRQAIIDATLPLVLAQGRQVTTQQIARAAGIAEGTIFRVFDSKDALLDAVVAQALDVEPYLRSLETLDASGGVEELITRVAQAMIDRFEHVFGVLTVLGIKGPPPAPLTPEVIARVGAAHARLLAPHTEELTLPPREVMRYVRLLAFSGTNPHLTDGRPLSAAEITSLVLDGTRKVR